MISQFKRDEIAFELRHEDEAIRRSQQARFNPKPAPVTYTADQVWAIAVRVDRINKGYVKLPVYAETLDVIKTEPNKVIVKDLIRNGYQPTDDEVEAGRAVRAHFNSYTFLALQGKLNDFQHQALKIAQMDSFTGRNMLEFSIISCLPDVARRDAARKEFMQALYASEQIKGTEGDKISGYLTVEKCQFNPNYNKFRVQGRMGESFVDFWFGRELLVGANLPIKGKIKRLRDDKSTQLNFVRVG
jgi:hypothetical protein